ncbi:unnamed protein product [Paramecium octaurelia]|uniref:Uncharacterized protein n=1 Tax=Paramecium octaurelia TaxID=43137 RepID=A0A8S1W4S9_PAROT|nr:unnamed protein product [Paramecium octaurelia]
MIQLRIQQIIYPQNLLIYIPYTLMICARKQKLSPRCYKGNIITAKHYNQREGYPKVQFISYVLQYHFNYITQYLWSQKISQKSMKKIELIN